MNSTIFSTPFSCETTDNTWTDVIILTIAENLSATVYVDIVARAVSSGKSKHWFNLFGVKRLTGDAVIDGGLTNVAGPLGDLLDMMNCDIRLLVDGDDLHLQVKGLNSGNVLWAGSLKGDGVY